MTSFLRAARRISSSEPFLYSNSLEQLYSEGRVGWKGSEGFMFLIQGVVRDWNTAAVWYLCIVDEVIVCAHYKGGGEEQSSHHQLVPVIKTLHNTVVCV